MLICMLVRRSRFWDFLPASSVLPYGCIYYWLNRPGRMHPLFLGKYASMCYQHPRSSVLHQIRWLECLGLGETVEYSASKVDALYLTLGEAQEGEISQFGIAL